MYRYTTRTHLTKYVKNKLLRLASSTLVRLWKYYNNADEVGNSRTHSVQFTALANSRKAKLFNSQKKVLCQNRALFVRPKVEIISSRIEVRDELSSTRTSFFPSHEGRGSRNLLPSIRDGCFLPLQEARVLRQDG